MGSRIRWFLTHGGAIVYNCLRLSSCADEGRADLLAILPSALYSHLTAVFHIYDTIQHFTLAVGADRCRDIIERYIENILELSFTGRTFVVHVPFDQRFFIGLFLLSTCMPYLNRCFGEVWGQCFWNEYHILWYFSGYLGYLVLAHYIHVHLTWNRSKRLVIGIASMLVGALLTIYSFYVQAIPGVTLVTPEIEIGWAFCTINCVLLTAGTFLAFTCIGNSKSPRLITEMSKLSYGMYLMHIFWLGLGVTVFKHDLALPTVAAIPCIAVSTFICCYVATKIISLIPGSKWIIG